MLKFTKGEQYYLIDSDSNDDDDNNTIVDNAREARKTSNSISGSPPNVNGIGYASLPLVPIVTLDPPNPPPPLPADTDDGGDQEQQMDALFRDVTVVQEQLLAAYPGMNVDPNVVFEQLEVFRADPERVEKVRRFLGTLEETYRAQPVPVDFRMHGEGNGNVAAVGGHDEADQPIGEAGIGGAPADHNDEGSGETGGLVDRDLIDDVATGRLGVGPITGEGPPWELRNGAGGEYRPQTEQDVHGGLMRDAQIIVEMFPNANFEEVYAHLEARRHEHNRVQNVVDDFLRGHPRDIVSPGPEVMSGGMPWPAYPSYGPQQYRTGNATVTRKRSADDDDEPGTNGALSLLLPSNHKMKRTSETTAAAAAGAAPVAVNGEAADGQTLLIDLASDAPPAVAMADEAAMAGPAFAEDPENPQAGGSSSAEADRRDWVATQLQSLMDTFPDADPVYLEDTIRKCGGVEEHLERAVQHMVEKSYPKRKEREERERQQALVNEYSIRMFTVDEILGWCENPLEFFYDQTKPVGSNYKSLVRIHLLNEFKKATPTEINKILLLSNYHLAPAIRLVKKLYDSKPRAFEGSDCLINTGFWPPELKLDDVDHIGRGHPIYIAHISDDVIQLQFGRPKTEIMTRRRGRRHEEIYKGEADMMFFKALAFCRVEDQLRESITTKEQERERRLTEGRRDGSLVTCLCCYDEDGLPDEMVDCDGGHMFCKTCVERGIDVAFGQGKTCFDCMADGCTKSFSLHMLKTALKPKVFSNWLRKIQEDEILKAQITDLVQCPFCSFAAIVPNPDDKVFRCMDPDCLKESCRLCKEVSHIPLRCDEVEKELEVKLRTAIENEMTEALLRKCNKCGRCFVKIDGCNKMTCPCGAHMCYVCKKPIKGYEHFQPHGPCPQVNDTAQMEAAEVEAAAQNAKMVVIEKHPELRDVEMKVDPTKTVAPPPPPGRPGIFNGAHQAQLHHAFQQHRVVMGMAGAAAAYAERMYVFPPPRPEVHVRPIVVGQIAMPPIANRELAAAPNAAFPYGILRDLGVGVPPIRRRAAQVDEQFVLGDPRRVQVPHMRFPPYPFHDGPDDVI